MVELVEKIAINGKIWKPGPPRPWSARPLSMVKAIPGPALAPPKTKKRGAQAPLNRQPDTIPARRTEQDCKHETEKSSPQQ